MSPALFDPARDIVTEPSLGVAGPAVPLPPGDAERTTPLGEVNEPEDLD